MTIADTTKTLADKLATTGLRNPGPIALAIIEHNIDPVFATAIALQESGGRQIYGHDAGGTFSTAAGPVTADGITYPMGSDVPVTPTNYMEFYRRVVELGGRSNGVGIYQITYAGSKRPDGTRSGGYLAQAKAEGLDLYLPTDNARFGCSILARHLVAAEKAGMVGNDRYRWAATVYNQGNADGWQTHPYGQAVMARVMHLRTLLEAPSVWRAVGSLHVRASWSLESPSVGVLAAGDRVVCWGPQRGRWVQVGVDQWVSSSWLASPI